MRTVVSLAVVACAVLLAAVIPSPYIVEKPGLALNTLGEVRLDDEPVDVITISGADTYETSGALNMLTVSIVGSPQHRLSWLSLVPALLKPAEKILPLRTYFPEGVSEDDRRAQGQVQMTASQQLAGAAAFGALGEPVPTVLSIAGVTETGPSSGLLETGDVLRSIDGEPLHTFETLRERLIAAGPGIPVELGVERAGKPRTVEVVPEKGEGDAPIIGAFIATDYELPAEVNISLSDIGGPSAGMIFALAIYDELTPGPLLDGLNVSGTGTIAADGSVGPVGGLPQKIQAAASAGSELMLMPLQNCADLPGKLPGRMHITPVETLDEAIDAVRTAADGGDPAGPERCEAAQAR